MKKLIVGLVVAMGMLLLPVPGALAAQECSGRRATLVGTDGSDNLQGTAGVDVIVGLGGNDRISGGAGQDEICGDAGDDDVIGGPGNDDLEGNAGNDELSGEEDRDFLDGGDGDDHVGGGAGNDYLRGNDGADLLEGLDGEDTLYGQLGADRLRGGLLNDYLSGGDGNDDLDGEEGDDRLEGDEICCEKNSGFNDDIAGGPGRDTAWFWAHREADQPISVNLAAGTATGQGNDEVRGVEDVSVESPLNDTVRGDGGPNKLSSSYGNDRMFGEDGDDELVDSFGDDEYDGGPGSDEISFYTRSNIVVNLLSESALGMGADKLQDIENVRGGDAADIITGDGGPNVLRGMDGSDVLRGRGGSDTLRGGRTRGRADRVDSLSGGLGDDLIDGGSPTDVDHEGKIIDGRDELDMSSATNPVVVDLAAGTATGEGNDTLIRVEDVLGSGYDDVISGDNGPNEINGSAGSDDVIALDGDDELEGSAGNDSFAGGPGTDILEFNNAHTAVTADLSAGTATGQGTDTMSLIENLRGTIFHDTLIGDDGPNTIFGHVGNDSIEG
ncbi:MAG: hypothetical protein M3198_01920, partial [Actinomycetota bacterium]|nr:hypothetical protein [Actinomycetota bacterium]